MYMYVFVCTCTEQVLVHVYLFLIDDTTLDPETLCVDDMFNHFQQLQIRLDFVRYMYNVHEWMDGWMDGMMDG